MSQLYSFDWAVDDPTELPAGESLREVTGRPGAVVALRGYRQCLLSANQWEDWKTCHRMP